MSKLIRNRWLHRAFFAGVLIALGVGIYRVTPPEAMCEIEARSSEPPRLFSNGRRLMTFSGRRAEFENPMKNRGIKGVFGGITTGPLKIWDTRTGVEAARHFDEAHELSPVSVSKGARFVAVGLSVIGDRPRSYKEPITSIAVLEVETGRLQSWPVHDRTRSMWDSLWLSRNGKLLASAAKEKSLRVYDTASGRVLLERDCRNLIQVGDENVAFLSGTDKDKLTFEVWNARENKRIAKLENVPEQFISSTPDGHLVFKRGPADGEGLRIWTIWNSRTLRIEGEFQSAGELAGLNPEQPFVLHCKNAKGEHLEFRDVPSGRLLGKMPATTGWSTCSDGGFLALQLAAAKEELEMREAPSMRTLWKRDLNGRIALEFGPDPKTFLVLQPSPRELQVLDARTAEIKAKVALPPRDRGHPHFYDSTDKRSLIVVDGPSKADAASILARLAEWIPMAKRFVMEKTETVVVLDGETGRERFRLNLHSDASLFVVYDEEGGTLVTMDRVIRCWDVNAYKPLRWAVGVPAGLGAVGVLLAGWRGRRAKGKAAAKEASDAAKQSLSTG